jgi:hypothetical protein
MPLAPAGNADKYRKGLGGYLLQLDTNCAIPGVIRGLS